MEKEMQNSQLIALLADSREQNIALQKQIETLNEDYTNQIERLNAQVAYLTKLLFGRRSERYSSLMEDPRQPRLFSEEDFSVQETPLPAVEEEQEEVQLVKARKRKGQRKENLDHLPHTKELIELDNPVCQTCGSQLEKIGEEFLGSRLIMHEPVFEVIDVYRASYKCPNCEKESGQTTIVKPEAPARVIENSYASAESVAHVISETFIKAVPYNRQLAEWKRHGLEMSGRTLSNWVMKVSEDYFIPLCSRLHEYLLQDGYIHADETPVDVFDSQEDGRKLKQCYMWVYSSLEQSKVPVRLYDFHMGRGGKYAVEFLKGFDGTLITDGYKGYEKVNCASHAGCWAHARRNFADSLAGVQKKNRAGTLADHALKMIGSLFRIERDCAGLSAEERLAIRKEKSQPIAEELFAWAEKMEQSSEYASSKLRKAFRYLCNYKIMLSRFLEDGNIPLTNSLDERTVRPFTVGRKNWMLRGSEKGAQAAAACYSLVETAKANGLDPYDYILYLLQVMPGMMKSKDYECFEKLLPWNEEIQKQCRQKK